MLIRSKQGWEIPERDVTPESAFWRRRDILKAAGLLALPALSLAAKRNPEFNPNLPITDEAVSTGYNNYYEFHPFEKEAVKNLVGKFVTSPWKVEISGHAQKQTLDLDDIMKKFPQEERVYRFRCVERWAMVVPWTGFPLSELIKAVTPDAKAKYVRFVTVSRPDQMPGMKMVNYPWPYFEGLRMDEALNPLTMVVTGLYGKPLPKQNGAPIRIITPWKYGYKSPKSIVKIEFVEKQPPTFWNQLQSGEYGFYSNVNPKQPHPRWSQAYDLLIPTMTRQRTLMYNGYENYVSGMYKGNEF